MKKQWKALIISWLIFSCFCLSPGFKIHAQSNELKENSELIAKVLMLIQKDYIDEVKLRDIVYPAIKEMVSQLDPYSYFLTPAENKTRKEKENDIQKYAGIGIQLGFRQSWQEIKELIKLNKFNINSAPIEIKKVFDGSPAQKVGLMPGDEIVALDNVFIWEIGAKEIVGIASSERQIEIKLLEVTKTIQGPVGISVILIIKRKGLAKPKVFTIIREEIQVRNVKWKIISTDKKNVGYLEIRGFMAQSTAKEVTKAIAEFVDAKVSGIIIDLRGNPGGFVSMCVDVLENFLPPNTLVISAKGRIGEFKYNTRHASSNRRSLPVVVLIDGGSASASEIVAGALRDYKKAILIGEKTFGKGSVQIVRELSDGSALGLTIQKYFLPNGECIHEKGILPSIEIETSLDEKIINKALEILINWGVYKKKFLN